MATLYRQQGTTNVLDEKGNKVSFTGNLDSLPVSDVITSDSLKSPDPVKIATPTPDGTNYGGITSSVTDSILNDYNSLNQKVKDKQTQQDQLGGDILASMKDLGNKAADTAAANEVAGVNSETENLNKAVQQLADLNAQASSLNREAKAIPLVTQERNANTGATDAGVAPQNKALVCVYMANALLSLYDTKDAAIQMLLLSITFEPRQIFARKMLVDLLEKQNAPKHIIEQQYKTLEDINKSKSSQLPLEVYYNESFFATKIN
jgi:hypothetical protein